MRPGIAIVVFAGTTCFTSTLLVQGCMGRNIEYEGGSGDTAPPEVVECGDESGFDVGYRIEGTVADLATGELLAWKEDESEGQGAK